MIGRWSWNRISSNAATGRSKVLAQPVFATAGGETYQRSPRASPSVRSLSSNPRTAPNGPPRAFVPRHYQPGATLTRFAHLPVTPEPSLA